MSQPIVTLSCMRQSGGSTNQVQRSVNKRLDAQFGVISRKQALAAGLSRSEIETKLRKELWTAVAPAVYKVGGSPTTREQRFMAAILWAGDGAVVSHRSAACLWGLEGEFDDVVEIICPTDKRPPAGVTVHYRRLASNESTYLGVLPVTTATRTLFDLASVIPVDDLLVARDDALRRRLTTWRRLRAQLDKAARGQAGTRTFRATLAGDNIGESHLERLFLPVVRKFKLPRPKLQYEVRLASGRTVFIDFAFPDDRLAIEIEGFGVHGQQIRWQQDMDRENELTELGWQVLRFSKQDLTKRPDRVASRILACLEIARSRQSA